VGSEVVDGALDEVELFLQGGLALGNLVLLVDDELGERIGKLGKLLAKGIVGSLSGELLLVQCFGKMTKSVH